MDHNKIKSQIIAKAWKDSHFREKLLADSKMPGEENAELSCQAIKALQDNKLSRQSFVLSWVTTSCNGVGNCG